MERLGPMQRLGKYEIRGVLGRGAMGTVYDGWDPHIARRVAIKTVRLPDSADSEERELLGRFQQEAQAAGRLQHPNVVGVFDYAETDELAYIVMEFVDGRTLKSILDGGGRPDPAEAGRLMSGLLAGLDYSHAHQVIHRDIKPANVIVTPAGVVKIADFGIARIGGSGMTLAGTIMGTPAYMSPEQFRGVGIDARTDIYSAGVVLFQLLTGKRPFEGSMATIMQAVLNEPFPHPSAMADSISPALDAVVCRAIARSPDERFQSAAEFDRTLQAALRGNAPPAHAPDVLAGGDATVIRPVPTQQPRPGRPGPAANPVPKPIQGATFRPRLRFDLAIAAAVLLAAGGGAYLVFGRGSSDLLPGPGPLAAIAPTPLAPAQAELAQPDPVRDPMPVPVHTPDASAPIPDPVVTVAPVPLPAPLPSSAPQPLRLSAVAVALGTVPCTAIGGEERPPGALALYGVSGPDAAQAVRDAVQAAAPGVSTTWQVAIAQGPYCGILDLLRPHVRPLDSTARSIGVTLLDGRVELVKDELLIPRVTMPEFRGHLQLDYISNDGSVVHLQQASASGAYPADATPVFGRPEPNMQRFRVDEPYGTDLIVAIASSTPLFRVPRAQGEPLDSYLRALRTALDQAIHDGGRVSAAVLLVRTAAR